MNGYWLIVCHLIGDYVLQSDYMANVKKRSSLVCAGHAGMYGLPFLFVCSLPAVAVIVATHFVIDRWSIPARLCWLKNFLAPAYTDEPEVTHFVFVRELYPTAQVNDIVYTPTGTCCRVLSIGASGVHVRTIARWHFPWEECRGTGYHQSKPAWLTVWLLILVDQTLHLLCNGLAATYL